jgi:hypothetical protein
VQDENGLGRREKREEMGRVWIEDWGLGNWVLRIEDWGLGIGDWVLGIGG